MKTSIQASMSNQTNELKNMMASFFQMNTASTSGLGPLPGKTIANLKGELKAITTRSGLVLDGPYVPLHPPFINMEEDERVEETLTNPELGEFTIKVPPPLIQKPKPLSQRNYVVHQKDPLRPNIHYPSRMHKQKQQEKDEMFTDKHALNYSSPLIYVDYDDDLDEFESSDFFPSPEYDSFLFEDFFEADALSLTNNEEKVFNLGILIYENLSESNVQATPDKNVEKIAISNASLILKDFNPPFYELPFHKEVLESKTLLSFSFENEEKVFKPGILTSKGVHTSLLPKLSHQGPKTFKVIKILKSPMETFPCSYGNTETKKVQKILLKKQFENFTASSSEGLD
nr:hypothetical protein [Tanacetum cinerariifolium]